MYTSKAVLKNKNFEVKSEESTTQLLNPIIILGQCFSLLPVNINKTKTYNTFEFKWLSIKVLYATIIFIGAGAVASMCFHQILVDGTTLHRAVDTGFYTSAALTVLLFAILSREWSTLMNIWTKVDINMNRSYGFPKHLHKKLKYTTVYFMVFAAVEHLLSLIFRIMDCQEYSGNCTASYYYENTYPQIFNFVDYSTVLAISTQAIHLWSTFTWNYNNLFIMLMSTILAERLKQITKRLKNYEKLQFLDNFWSTVREDYDKLCYLCYNLDASLSYIILLSYGTNLFFILIQLYNSLMKDYRNVVEKAYFFFSFGFLIFRTVAVSLYAAQINDASKEPAVILHSVPSSIYNNEIKRFLQQISFDTVVLTGSKMFKITRGLILNIAGAIVTYELVLIQFNINPLR